MYALLILLLPMSVLFILKKVVLTKTTISNSLNNFIATLFITLGIIASFYATYLFIVNLAKAGPKCITGVEVIIFLGSGLHIILVPKLLGLKKIKEEQTNANTTIHKKTTLL